MRIKSGMSDRPVFIASGNPHSRNLRYSLITKTQQISSRKHERSFSGNDESKRGYGGARCVRITHITLLTLLTFNNTLVPYCLLWPWVYSLKWNDAKKRRTIVSTMMTMATTMLRKRKAERSERELKFLLLSRKMKGECKVGFASNNNNNNHHHHNTNIIIIVIRCALSYLEYVMALFCSWWPTSTIVHLMLRMIWKESQEIPLNWTKRFKNWKRNIAATRENKAESNQPKGGEETLCWESSLIMKSTSKDL